jgi:formylmethanofuran dehydrogenase subunit E
MRWTWKGESTAVHAVSLLETAFYQQAAFPQIGTIMELEQLLERSAQHHSHLCPRQILGVRIGLAGMRALGLGANVSSKRLLVILETDGCFADGIIAATDCTVGHRTLRVEDYGMAAATFVDTRTGKAVRVAPRLDIRQQACAFCPEEPRHYFAQMNAYQVMPDEQLLTVTEVQLVKPLEQILSRPGVRVECTSCGEEIMNEREMIVDGQPLCRACAGVSYYRVPIHYSVLSSGLELEQR